MNRTRAAALLFVVALSGAASAQTGTAQWVAWARDHSFPIASVAPVEDDDFADLQFLKSVIGDRRIVQLGESGHGVAEFDSAKARLVRFFHEQMGFDVIAFESSMYECFVADASAAKPRAVGQDVMAESIFSVWWTRETVPLFDYLVQTKSTDRPLTLAGFDSQWSSISGLAGRPAFFRRIVGAVDAAYADEVERRDIEFTSARNVISAYTRLHQQELVEFYSRLEGFLHDHREALAAAFPGDSSPLIAERTARSMIAFVRQTVAADARPNDLSELGAIYIRDRAMADNLAFLARELFPGRKVLVWAHNFHVRHANGETASNVKSMGTFVLESFRDELYTIGLYMNRGQAAYNDRTVYTISPALDFSLEWVLFGAGPPALFVDFLGQRAEPGNEWMFSNVSTRDWGINALQMVPRAQYDGVLFIDRVRAPQYVSP